MANDTTADRYCIIGAGPGGLTTAKNFRDQSIPFHCLERQSDIGGLWNFAMPGAAAHRSTTMISSKKMSRFSGFPMPGDYPDFPNHSQVLAYFRAYAKAFDLERDIQCNSRVDKIERRAGHWAVQVAGETAPRIYKGIVVANGHHYEPLWPKYPGAFTGESVHVRDYVGPEQFDGKRVLVVGGGTSGCDAAVDAAQRAVLAAHSTRRGYHIIPKYVFGRPSDQIVDQFMRWPLPRGMKDRLCESMLNLVNGRPERYGLRKPEHGLFESHPTVSQLYPFYVGHQRIQTKADISRFDGKTVTFTDGTSEDFDLILYATGYEISMPFIDSALVMPEGRVKLDMNIFHPDIETLFFVGLIQVNGGAGWPLMDQQARLIASYIVKPWVNGARETWRERMRGESRNVLPRKYLNTPRHTIEVRRHEYKHALQKLQAAIGT